MQWEKKNEQSFNLVKIIIFLKQIDIIELKVKLTWKFLDIL